MARPNPIHGVALVALHALRMGTDTRASLDGLDTNHDQFIDVGELQSALISRPLNTSPGQMFSQGIFTRNLRRSLMATFQAMNPPCQFSLLLQMGSWEQASLFLELTRTPRTMRDAAYLWYQFASHENGILGGILLRHLQALDPLSVGRLMKEVYMPGVVDSRPLLKAHQRTADQAMAWHPLPKTGPLMPERGYMGYFPHLAAFVNDANIQKMPVIFGKAVPQSLQTYAAQVVGNQVMGGVGIVLQGHAYILPVQPGYLLSFSLIANASPGMEWAALGVDEGTAQVRLQRRKDLFNEDDDESSEHIYIAIESLRAMLEENPKEYRAHYYIGACFRVLATAVEQRKTGHGEFKMSPAALLHAAVDEFRAAQSMWEARKASGYFNTHPLERNEFGNIPTILKELDSQRQALDVIEREILTMTPDF